MKKPKKVNLRSAVLRLQISKRAQVESQLNWIFILIVGAIILAFFTVIVMKQKTASEAKFAGKISQQLNTILVGAKVSSGTVQEIPTPDLAIRFTCNDYYIGPASQRLGNKIIFAPENIEANKLITWTRDWNVPFKITSFLYVTTPFIRYIVIGNDGDFAAQELFEELPQKLNKKIYSMSDYSRGAIRNEGDKYVRFIFVNPTEFSFDIPLGFEDVDVTGITVGKSISSGKLQFLVNSGTRLITSGPQFDYIEPEPFFGAIFSTSAKEYECVMERAYNRLNLVTQVYIEKLREIDPVYRRTNCEGFYANNVGLIDLNTSTNHFPLTDADYTTIASAKLKLREDNERLQLYSCSLIY